MLIFGGINAFVVCLFALHSKQIALSETMYASNRIMKPFLTTGRLAWTISCNHRQLTSSRSDLKFNLPSRYEETISKNNKHGKRGEWIMCTDSRKLRYLEQCFSIDSPNRIPYRVSTSSCQTYNPSYSTGLFMDVVDKSTTIASSASPRNQISSSRRAPLTETTHSRTVSRIPVTKSTMSILEEMISSSYYRVLEENHELVSTMFRPLLSTIHSNYSGSFYPFRSVIDSHTHDKVQANGTPDIEKIETSSGSYKTSNFPATFRRTEAADTSISSGKSSSVKTVRSSVTAQRIDVFSTSEAGKRSFSGVKIDPTKLQTTVSPDERPVRSGYGSSIQLTDDERDLFHLLRRVRIETNLKTTLRVAGGWVRDKLLATPEFQTFHKVYRVGKEDPSKISTNRLTSKFRRSRSMVSASLGRQGTKILTATSSRSGAGSDFQPVDIDIALDDMLGREFADHLNEYLAQNGQETVSVGMVLKNPEKSKHLETATMKVNSFWIDFVNLRAEEYTQNSRIPDLMRIGTAKEDAFRRDLTINALFYNINTGEIEDWTGRGFDDLRKGVIATPLHPLTTLLDDPLRVLRSIRFAARLRFTMDDALVKAAKDVRVADALLLKVSRERVGGELDLMLRSPDPVGAVRLLCTLNLIQCVFPVANYIPVETTKTCEHIDRMFKRGLELLSMTHDHLADCKWSPPIWWSFHGPIQPDTMNDGTLANTQPNQDSFCESEIRLLDDEESRRLLWYASFTIPMVEEFHRLKQSSAGTGSDIPPVSKRSQGKKSNRSIVNKILIEDLKRPNRDSDAVERIVRASDDFMEIVSSGGDVTATMILLSEVRVVYDASQSTLQCYMHGRKIDSSSGDLDPIWEHAMEFRLLCAKVLSRIGPLWQAALCLAIARDLYRLLRSNASSESGDVEFIEYAIEGDIVDETNEEFRQGVIEKYDLFATAMHEIGIIGIWNEKPLADGDLIRTDCLRGIPPGPAFRDVMDEQTKWMITHPGGDVAKLLTHLQETFPDFVSASTSAKNCGKHTPKEKWKSKVKGQTQEEDSNVKT